MGFFRDMFRDSEDRDRRRAARTKASTASLSTHAGTNGSSSAKYNEYTSPTSPTTSVSSRTSIAQNGFKRSSSPPPPVPPLPGLPSDQYNLQETLSLRRERELERERDRLEKENRALRQLHQNGSQHYHQREREREHAPPAGYSLQYSGAETLRIPPGLSPPSPPPIAPSRTSSTRSDRHASDRDAGPFRANGLVAPAPSTIGEERESVLSDDGSSVHRRERELVRDYEAAISRQMERLGSASSIGNSSVVSGLSGVKGWGMQPQTQPFANTVDEADKLKVIVVGSGFAGLATAIACSRQGYSVTVVERGSGLSPHGDLITLGSNCTRILARWGLFSDMWKRSAHGGWWLIKAHDSGELIGGQDLRDFPQVFGAPLMQGHRAQYLGVLGVEARMQQVGFRPNTEVVEYRDGDEYTQPSIVTARGEVLSADCIVVCDGVNSYAKAFLAPELGGALGNLREEEEVDENGDPVPVAAPPKPAQVEEPNDEGKKYSVHRAAMMSDRLRENPKTAYFLDGCMRTFVGPDSHLKIAPLDDNRQVSFTYLSRSRYAASTNWRDRRPVKEVTDALEAEGWDESVIEAVKAFRTCLNWAVAEAPPSDRWVTESGKIILIGDAVHALSPLSFQGGSQAIEDGAALAVCLALSGGKSEDVPRALRAMEIMRKPRVAEAQVRGTKQRHLWHSYYDNKELASLDLNITEAYHHDVELHTVATFERTVQNHLAGERDFIVDPRRKKDVLRRLEINGRHQREAEADMMDPDTLWQNGGMRPKQ
ncbi:hypothetical protein JCM11251_007413 [Rhodosporidiobolus azoricus]